jgi:quinol monooxygenase YgiN
MTAVNKNITTLKIVAKCRVNETDLSSFKQYAADLIAQTQQEPGNISYALCEDIKDPTILTFIEEWQDQKALDTHNTSKHFTTIFPKLTLLTQTEIEVNIYKKC